MIYLVVGFIGAFLMFCGDMLLYYDPHDFNYEPGDSFEVKMKAILEIMVRVSPKRLMAGGLLADCLRESELLFPVDGRI